MISQGYRRFICPDRDGTAALVMEDRGSSTLRLLNDSGP